MLHLASIRGSLHSMLCRCLGLGLLFPAFKSGNSNSPIGIRSNRIQDNHDMHVAEYGYTQVLNAAL